MLVRHCIAVCGWFHCAAAAAAVQKGKLQALVERGSPSLQNCVE